MEGLMGNNPGRGHVLRHRSSDIIEKTNRGDRTNRWRHLPYVPKYFRLQ